MRILILGGSKFIGRAVVDLLAVDHDVTVLVRGESEPPDGVRVVLGDRTVPGVADLVREAFDAVVDVSGTTPEMITNLEPAFVEWAFDRYIYVGSGSVYDRETSDLPFRESEPAVGDAIWAEYGVAKAECEDALRTSVDDNKLVILRPPYVYGPRNYEERERTIWAHVLGGHPIYMPLNEAARIQFCHVDVLAKVIAAGVTGELDPGTYNVCEERTYGLREYVELCARVAGHEAVIVPSPDPSVRPRDYFPFRAEDFYLDGSRLAEANVVDNVDLESGLRETFAWHLEHGGLEYEPTTTETAWSGAS